MSASLQPLWEIEQELEALLDGIDTCPEELREELEAQIVKYLGMEREKVDRAAGALTSLELMASNAKSEIERLRLRQQSAERSAERLRGYLLRVIQRHDGKPLVGRNTTFSVRASEAVVIQDMDAVPEEWKRTITTVDVPKAPLKTALKAGLAIPGASLETRPYLVRK